MRTIISNDLSRLYGRIDYSLLEKTKTSTKVLVTATEIPVINSSGFSVNDFVCINNPGNERSEMRQINSISGNNVYVSTPTTYELDNKTNIYKCGYDLIKFYGDDTVIATISIKPDYLVSKEVTLSSSVAYSMSYFNTTTSSETAKGEAVYVTDNLLASSADIFKYEDLDILGSKVIDKLDISSRDIRNIFRGQDQDIKDVDEPYLLNSACALNALYYIFLEISKNEGDISEMKSKKYKGLYDSEKNKILEIISKEDSNVRVYGQTRCER